MKYKIIKCTRYDNTEYYYIRVKKRTLISKTIYWETLKEEHYDEFGSYTVEVYFSTFEEAEDHVNFLRGDKKREVVAEY